MPNICNANIYIKGRKDCVDKFIQVLRENYNYGDDSDWKDANTSLEYLKFIVMMYYNLKV